MKIRRAAFLALALAIPLAACTSPEATRVRAGGPGGDLGNRKPIVEMHDGAGPYWNTPHRLARPVGMEEVEVAASPRAPR